MKVMNNGRILIPKSMRDKYNLDRGIINFIETEEGLLIRSSTERYYLEDYQIDLLRKLYFTIKDSMILDDKELKEFKEICRVSNVKCPNCKEDMVIDNGSYKCIKCE